MPIKAFMKTAHRYTSRYVCAASSDVQLSTAAAVAAAAKRRDTFISSDCDPAETQITGYDRLLRKGLRLGLRQSDSPAQNTYRTQDAYISTYILFYVTINKTVHEYNVHCAL